jgi:anti-anti-sigma factor
VVVQASRDEESRDPIQVELQPERADGYVAVVSLCGEHDLATSGAIRTALAPLDGDVLVDLTDCEFIDSSVISELLEKYEDLRREGHRLELVVPHGRTTVRRIVDVIGLGTLLTLHDSMPSAGDPGASA